MRDPIADLKSELLAAAERQHAVGSSGPQRFRVSMGRHRLVLTAATVAVAAAVALFVSTPWQSSPGTGFLEDVQAALTPPPPGEQVMHMKWEHIVTSEDPACTSTGVHEVWIDLKPPHTYRAFVPLPPATALPVPGSGGLHCPELGTPVEVGGTRDGPAVRFVPPNTLARAHRYSFYTDDPWEWVRTRIGDGLAHRDGTAKLYGQTLERVRLDPPASCPAEAAGHCPIEPEYVYFDPETLTLVVWDYARDPTLPLVRQRERYLAFEYLPRTDDNLALTDIRAQHPDAIER